MAGPMVRITFVVFKGCPTSLVNNCTDHIVRVVTEAGYGDNVSVSGVRVTDMSGQDRTITSRDGAEAGMSSASGGGRGNGEVPNADQHHEVGESREDEEHVEEEEDAAMEEASYEPPQGKEVQADNGDDTDDDVMYLGTTAPTSQRNSPHVSVSDEAPDEGPGRGGEKRGGRVEEDHMVARFR
jgi:hypothetical protein